MIQNKNTFIRLGRPVKVIVEDANILKDSDGDFGEYFHLPVSVNFGKWILFTGKLPVNKKNQLTP
jgi:hypothetical protein